MGIVHLNLQPKTVIWSNWTPRYPLHTPRFQETWCKPFSSVKMSEPQPLRYVDVGSPPRPSSVLGLTEEPDEYLDRDQF